MKKILKLKLPAFLSAFTFLLTFGSNQAKADEVDDWISEISEELANLYGMAEDEIAAAIAQLFADLFGVGACSGSGTIGDVLCNMMISTSNLPGFLTALGYALGLILSVSALLKLKDHVISPSQHPLSDSMKRFVAASGLFALPMVTEATQNLITGGVNDESEVTGYAGLAAEGYGLDTMMMALFMDIFQPAISLFLAFGYLAGLVLVFVGITRMIKSAQDGPRGPSGMGTIMTFVIAGVLFSLSTMMSTFSTSLFGDSMIATYAELQTSTGDEAVDEHILAVISTTLVFLTIVGWISFIRGFFILREVAEGSSQASLMAATTHIIGGAIAVNLGPFMNAVQSTFGIDTFGIDFV